MKSLRLLLAKAEVEVEALEARERTLRAEAADVAADMDEAFTSIARRAGSLSSLEERAELCEDLARVVRVVEVHEPAGNVRVWLRGDDELPILHPLRPGAQLPGL